MACPQGGHAGRLANLAATRKLRGQRHCCSTAAPRRQTAHRHRHEDDSPAAAAAGRRAVGPTAAGGGGRALPAAVRGCLDNAGRGDCPVQPCKNGRGWAGGHQAGRTPNIVVARHANMMGGRWSRDGRHRRCIAILHATPAAVLTPTRSPALAGRPNWAHLAACAAPVPWAGAGPRAAACWAPRRPAGTASGAGCLGRRCRQEEAGSLHRPARAQARCLLVAGAACCPQRHLRPEGAASPPRTALRLLPEAAAATP